MANNAENIKNSWSFLSFARMKGRAQIAPLKNKKTNEQFKSLVFTDETNPDEETNKVFVNFSPKLGELSKEEIQRRKHDLQVVECLNKEGETIYRLCEKGESAWEDLDL